MVYDSEYTRTECDAAETDPLPDTNRTAVRMIRRLIAELKTYKVEPKCVQVLHAAFVLLGAKAHTFF